MQTTSRARRATAVPRREPRCIYCGNAREGLRVREDMVIASMRWFNRKVLKRYRDYRLVVCKECYLNWKKARKRFMRKQITYMVIGFLFAGLLVTVAPGNAFTYVYGLAVVVFMYLLSLVSYVPALEVDTGDRPAGPPPSNRAKSVQRSNRIG